MRYACSITIPVQNVRGFQEGSQSEIGSSIAQGSHNVRGVTGTADLCQPLAASKQVSVFVSDSDAAENRDWLKREHPCFLPAEHTFALRANHAEEQHLLADLPDPWLYVLCERVAILLRGQR